MSNQINRWLSSVSRGVTTRTGAAAQSRRVRGRHSAARWEAATSLSRDSARHIPSIDLARMAHGLRRQGAPTLLLEPEGEEDEQVRRAG